MEIFLLLFGLFWAVYVGDIQECEVHKKCDTCLSHSSACAWCEHEPFLNRRCNTEKVLLDQGCPVAKLVQIPSTATASNPVNNDFYSVSASKVEAVFRKHGTVSFNIRATIKKQIPVELIYAFDATQTMDPLFKKLSGDASTFIKQGLTDGISKIGVVTFVDKIMHPNINAQTWVDNAPDNPFNLKTVCSPSASSDVIEGKLKDIRVTHQTGHFSNSLDAILQIIACDRFKEDPSLYFIRMIALFTDKIFKHQSMGSVLGILKPNDLKCKIDANGNDIEGIVDDYVSVGALGPKLAENRQNIIFIVPQEYHDIYNELKTVWPGINIKLVSLVTNPANIDIMGPVLQMRDEIHSSISLRNSYNSDLSIRITATCPSEQGSDPNPSRCVNVKFGQEVDFRVDVESLVDNPSGSLTFYLSSFTQIILQYSEFKSCGCTKSSASTHCSVQGEDECGACECDREFGGEKCECSTPVPDAISKCTHPKTQTVCSRNGDCNECGVCICKTAPDNKPYSGKYCECSRERCGEFNDKVCGGEERGKCVCDACVCTKDYYGQNCEVKDCLKPRINEKCIQPESTVECSGAGSCACGICTCNIHFVGEFCQTDNTPIDCLYFQEETSCFVDGQPLSNYTCNTRNVTAKFVAPEGTFECVYVNSEGCKISFNFAQTAIKVYKIEVKMKEASDCPRGVNFVVLGISSFFALLIAGLTIMAIYLVTRYIFFRREFKRFEKEKCLQEPAAVNPLYEEKAHETDIQELSLNK